MLVFLLFSACLFHFQLTRSKYYLSYPLFVLFFLLYFLVILPLPSLSTPSIFASYLADSFSLSIVVMSSFVVFISYLFTLSLSRFSYSTLTLFYMLLFSVIAFTTNNLFIFYLVYEASLLPIVLIILVWGAYSDRSQASFLLLSFTALFTMPVLYIIFYIFDTMFTVKYSALLLSSSILPPFLSALVVFAFIVKLPVYGLHHWLPIAHVEAPTHGSIILAGILLNLGGIGLVRFSPVLDLELALYLYLPFFCIFNFIVPVICLIQSDFKRLVAYSSVSHMLVVPLLVFSSTCLSYNALVLVMFFHGLSSPLIFMVVGLVYDISASRLLFAIRGVSLAYPLLSFIMCFSLLFSLSAPPMPSFFSEVLSVFSLIHLSLFIVPSFFFFLFFSLVYSLSWFSNICFSSSSVLVSSTYGSLHFISAYAVVLPVLFCLPLVLVADLL